MTWQMMGKRPVSSLAISVMVSCGLEPTKEGWKPTGNRGMRKPKRKSQKVRKRA